MKQEGKSLKEMAKELGVSPSYLSQIRHGKRRPSHKVLSMPEFKILSRIKQQVALEPAKCYNPPTLETASGSVGHRLAVGQRTLDPLAEVRILVPQLFNLVESGAFV